MISPFASVSETSRLLRDKEISPIELTRFVLERIARVDRTVNAFITVTDDLAMSQAAAAEREIMRGAWRGALHGMPYSLKDVFLTRGIRTTAHSRVLENWIPETDAACVERMRDAGAILIGKTATQEFSCGAVTEGPWPPARNPWDTNYTPSGSSSGAAAAVAAGIGFAAIGGDTAGSIRTPAATNGIVGLRPTYGRVSKYGTIPLAWSIDTCGPLTRTVRDAAIVLSAISGRDDRDPSSSYSMVPAFEETLAAPIRGLRAGIDKAHFLADFVHPEVLGSFETAVKTLESLGMNIVEVEMPTLDHVHAALNVVHMCEAHAYHADKIRAIPALYGPTARAYFRLGAFVSAFDYLRAQQLRAKARAEMLAAFDNVDVIVAPTASGIGERFDAIDTSRRFKTATGKPNLALPFSAAGVPAISVPCGFSQIGLPLGLQIAAAPFREDLVLRVADAFERASDWHVKHPTI